MYALLSTIPGSSFCRLMILVCTMDLLTCQGYELREYDATVWVDTQMPAMETDFWEDRSQMSGVFMRLFRYITGANEQSE